MTKPIETSPGLDPVTFEVLKNSFITTVDQMAEQMLRTCYSFVIYNRDFSNALHDADGNSVAQGNHDIAVHVGTLHFTCKEVIRVFEGDMHPATSTRSTIPMPAARISAMFGSIRPIFDDGKTDRLLPVERPLVGSSAAACRAPSTSPRATCSAKACASRRCAFSQRGRFCTRRRPHDRGQHARSGIDHRRHPCPGAGDAGRPSANSCGWSRNTGAAQVMRGMAEVQDYVERAVRQRLAALPDGTWETVDFIDRDLGAGEGMIPIRIKMTIKGDTIHLRFHRQPFDHCLDLQFRLRARRSRPWSPGMKTFFPDLPLNSGFLPDDRGDRAEEQRSSARNGRWR